MPKAASFLLRNDSAAGRTGRVAVAGLAIPSPGLWWTRCLRILGVTRLVGKRLFVVLILWAACLVLFYSNLEIRSNVTHKQSEDALAGDRNMLVRLFVRRHAMPLAFSFPSGPSIGEMDPPVYGIKYKSLVGRGFQRRIRKDPARMRSRRRSENRAEEEELPFPYNLLDVSYVAQHEKKSVQEGCELPLWTYELHPTCNSLHESILFDNRNADSDQHLGARYLAQGFFRHTWFIADVSDRYVIKTTRLERPFEDNAMARIQVEALIMERTTWSPRTMSIHGHCALSVAVEWGVPLSDKIMPKDRVFSHEALAREWDNEVKPFNEERLSVKDKLDLATAMAEGLAALHGHHEGVMLHNDLHLEQWLYGRDGQLKLNDYNQGRFLSWNPRTQEYCGVHVKQKKEYRSPEELKGGIVDERAEAHSLGKFLFTLLTGLMPYYWLTSDKALLSGGVSPREARHGRRDLIKNAVLRGEHPPIDDRFRTRSLVEQRLVELIEMLWPNDVDERATVFDAVAHLRTTRQLYEDSLSRSDI